MRRWAWNILIALDQLANAIAGGDPAETVTDRAARARRRGAWWAVALCAVLHALDDGHCDPPSPNRASAWRGPPIEDDDDGYDGGIDSAM